MNSADQSPPQYESLQHIRQEAMEFAGIGLYRFAFDGTVLFMDRAAWRIFELDAFYPEPAAVHGKKIADIIIYVESKGALRKEIREKGAIRGRLWHFKTLKGNDRWLLEDSYLVRDEHAGEDVIQIIFRDVTEQHRTQHALQSMERQFRETLENVSLPVVQIDHNAKVTFCNRCFLQITGWKPEEIIDRDWFDTCVPQALRESMRQEYLTRVVKEETAPTHYDMPLLTRGGTSRSIFWSNTLIRGEGQAVLGMTCIGQDMTEQRNNEKTIVQAAQTSEQMRALLITLSQCKSIGEMLRPLLQTALAISGMEAGGIYLIEGDEAVLRCNMGAPEDFVRKVSRIPLSGAGPRFVLEADGAVELTAIQTEQDSIYRAFGYHHVYTTALRSGDEVFGFLSVSTAGDDRANSSILHALSVMALEAAALLKRLHTEKALQESEARSRATLDNMVEAVHLIDKDFRIIVCNRTLLEWNKSLHIHADMEGKNLFDVYPFLGPKVRDEYNHVLNTGMATFTEERNIVDGRAVYTETRKIPVLEQGVATRVITVMRNVTEAREQEIALRESEEKYRTLVEMFPLSLTIFQDAKVAFANRATMEIFRYPNIESLVGQDIMTVVADREKERLSNYAQARYAVPATAPAHYETVLKRFDGEEFAAEVYVKMIALGGRPAQQVLVSDITERKRALQAIQESEERYRDILQSIREGYYEVNLKGDFVFFNKALCRIFGYSPEEMRGMNYSCYYPSEDATARVRSLYRDVMETGEDKELADWVIVRKDGSLAALEVSVSLIRGKEGAPVGFRGMVRDVSARTKAEQALREAEARYRELFENANDIVYTHDLSGRFLSINKAGERISGYARQEMLQMGIFDLIAPEHHGLIRTKMQQKVSNKDSTQYELTAVAKDGRIIPLEVSTRIVFQRDQPVAVQGIARDITERKQAEEERKRLEAQLRHTQKLEGLGVMAGGIAHDFNNLLVGVLGNAGLALSHLPQDSQAVEYLERIELAAQRAAELTNQMLAYSGRGSFMVQPINLSALTQEMGRLLAVSVSKKAVLQYDCLPDLPLIEGDKAQLQQVLMNLIVNASEALGDARGVISIRTRMIPVDRAYLAGTYYADDLTEGLYIALSVSDTGCGMDAETVARIFDPFFSTKFTGRGLGLAAVLGIVRNHRGAIKVLSAPGKGTTFKILFPAISSAASSGAAPVAAASPEKTVWRHSGLVLLADDEESVRLVTQEVLEDCGFSVLTAADGQEAWELFRKHADELTAVLLDLMMPRMNGVEVFEKIRAVQGDIPVLLSSGYPEQDAARHFKTGKPSAFVQKPYFADDLLMAMRQALGES